MLKNIEVSSFPYSLINNFEKTLSAELTRQMYSPFFKAEMFILAEALPEG